MQRPRRASAAELLGADSAPLGVPAEIVSPHRFGAYIVMRRPDVVAARVRTRLLAAAHAAGIPLEALSAA